MNRKTKEMLATALCCLGLSFTIIGVMLCPQSLYADQGTAAYLPCSIGCEQSLCTGRRIAIEGCPATNAGCNALGSGFCTSCQCLPGPGIYCDCH